jgi:hypothetical protein
LALATGCGGVELNHLIDRHLPLADGGKQRQGRLLGRQLFL